MSPSNLQDFDSEDYFRDTRMSFGDHLEELRWRMWAALKGLLLCMFIGFILDGIGDAMEWPNFGVGRPALKFITSPIETQVREFHNKRNQESLRKREIELKEENERARALQEMVPVTGKIDAAEFCKQFKGLELNDPEQKDIVLTMKVNAADLDYGQKRGEIVQGYRPYLTALSVTEGFMVYFKVSLLCGFILACPWIFFQFWAFVGAGLYPHEKRYVYLSIFPSTFLFLVGIVICQVWVMPGAVKTLLGFNAWIDVDPDLRLREWLGFAILLPLVFGLSFQTPLVMVVLNRAGMFTWQDYLRQWRYISFGLMVFAAVITPTPDIVTLMYLFVPMFTLYLVGIGICYLLPPPFPPEDEFEEEVAV